ncbi:MAG TPA: protein phosphatase 2C domain-containing protein [Ilumatobacteraceae bacterium]|jgi:serine/threonine protein phosphatase PrpC
MTEAELACPACGAPIAAGDTFCEACGAQLDATANAGSSADTPPAAEPVDVESPVPRTVVISAVCANCGGKIMDDGFCGTCGQKARSPRDHWTEQPAPWVGGVCDKGTVHTANEDAMALAATGDGALGIIVVCDGVTSAPNSDRAALAASRAACSELASLTAPASSSVAADVTYWTDALLAAAREANAAAVGVAHTLGDPAEPPSCTFVAAVVSGSLVAVAWCGDSRAYWLPDDAEARQLTVDHSLGSELLASGRSRAEAEADPAFHTITRWLGADSVDHAPEVTTLSIDGAGWLLVCSDGLWNYASEVNEMRTLLSDLSATAGTDPVQLAGALVDWANAAGGHDNITAALARCDPSLRFAQERTSSG